MGQIPDNFDPYVHIPISPGCFIGREHVYPNFENLEYINIFTDKKELKYFDELTSKEALSWVNIIAKKYNPLEFDKHSFLFWKTIYFPWLGYMIPWIYRRQLLVGKTIRKYKDESLLVKLFDKKTSIYAKDEAELLKKCIKSTFGDEWLSSYMMLQQAPSNWIIRSKEVIASEPNGKELAPGIKKVIKARTINIFTKIFYRSNGVYGFNLLNALFFHLLFSFKPAVKVTKKIEEDYKSKIKWEFDILDILDAFIPNNLKNIAVEIENTRSFKQGKLINFSNSLYYNLNKKIEAANCYEKGEIVITTQHGGHNYGSSLTFDYNKYIEFDSDYFISWGNKYYKGVKMANFLPLPSPLLSKFLNKHKSRNNKVIVVGTDMSIFPTRFGISGLDVLKYREEKLKLLCNLTKVIELRNLYYKPYPQQKSSLKDDVFFSTKIPGLKILNTNLHDELQKCKLLILDHPGTTWNIAMAMNTPIICCWKREHRPFNEEADIFLDRFKKLGLFFENTEEAAKILNLLIREYGDLTVWWNQKEIQDLRKDWMNIYARAHKNWFWIWSKAMWKIK